MKRRTSKTHPARKTTREPWTKQMSQIFNLPVGASIPEFYSKTVSFSRVTVSCKFKHCGLEWRSKVTQPRHHSLKEIGEL